MLFIKEIHKRKCKLISSDLGRFLCILAFRIIFKRLFINVKGRRGIGQSSSFDLPSLNSFLGLCFLTGSYFISWLSFYRLYFFAFLLKSKQIYFRYNHTFFSVGSTSVETLELQRCSSVGWKTSCWPCSKGFSRRLVGLEQKFSDFWILLACKIEVQHRIVKLFLFCQVKKLLIIN